MKQEKYFKDMLTLCKLKNLNSTIDLFNKIMVSFNSGEKEFVFQQSSSTGETLMLAYIMSLIEEKPPFEMSIGLLSNKFVFGKEKEKILTYFGKLHTLLCFYNCEQIGRA